MIELSRLLAEEWRWSYDILAVVVNAAGEGLLEDILKGYCYDCSIVGYYYFGFLKLLLCVRKNGCEGDYCD